MDFASADPMTAIGALLAVLVGLIVLNFIVSWIRVAILKRRFRFAQGTKSCPECGSTRFRRGRLTGRGYRYICQGRGCGTAYAYVPGIGIVDKLAERRKASP